MHHLRKFPALFALCLALVLGAPVALARGTAQGNPAPAVVLRDSQGEYHLDSNLELLADPTGKLTLEDVMSESYARQFIPNENGIPGIGLQGGVLWVRVRVQNTSTRNDWLIGINEARIAYLTFYLPDPRTSTFRPRRTGSYLPFDTRMVADTEFYFSLALPPGTSTTYYFRVEAPSAVDVPLEIWSPEAFAGAKRREGLLYGLFYGAMLIMAGYNFFVFLSLRDRVYLYLTIVILGFALGKATQDGVAHQYLWPSRSNQGTIEYSVLVTMLAASYFTTTFLQARARAPRLHLAFNVWRIALLVTALLVPFINALPAIIALVGVELALILAIVLRAWGGGYRPARLFLASWCLPLIATLIYVLYNVGLVPSAWFTNNPVLAFLAALALFWSLVLADRINLLRAETQSANRSLARSERQYRSLFQDSLDAVFITTRTGKIVDLNPSGLKLLGYAHNDLAQMDARDLFETQVDYARLQKTLEEQGFVVDHETRLRCRDGSLISAIVSGTLWHDEEHGLSGYQGIFRDVTEHRRTQQELATYRLHLEDLVTARTMQADAELAERRRAEAALERRVQELSALSEIAKTISTVTDLSPALNLVAERVTRLFDIAATAIGEMDHGARTMRLLAGYPPAPQGSSLVGNSWFWDTVPLLQQILQLDRPLLIEDPQTDPTLGSAHDLAVQYHLTGLMLVPLRVGRAVIGVLILSAAGGEPFRKEGVLNLAETIGGSIANAIDNARLYQQAQATAIAHERQRLARELHDSVTQLLYSIVLLAEGRRVEAEQAELDSKTLGQSFNELGELGQQALGEMRLLLYQLRAPVLKEMGLSGALQQRLNAVEQRVGIQTYLYTNGDLETLPLLVQEELYFIAQEALNNALRHARASEIQVRLVKQNDHVELVVQDNGTGFDMDEISEGMGLRNMHARAQLINARLEIHTWIGTGTRVQLHMRFESYATPEAAEAPDERE